MSANLKTPSLLLFALGFILYANTISFDYALDDKIVIIHNEFTKQGIDGIKDLVSNDAMVGFFGKKKNLVSGGRYRPFTLITHALEWEFFGKSPGISHFINAMLYGLSCYILFLLLADLFPITNKWWLSIAFFTSLLWATHPLHTEVVANIKGRDEILSLLFALVAFRYYLKSYSLFTFTRWILVLLFFGLSLMSKESSITFLVIFPLAVYFFKEFDLKKAGISMSPLLIVTFVYLIIRSNVIGGMQTEVAKELMNNPYVNATNIEKYATTFLTYLLYFKLLVFPHPLTHDYYPKQIELVGFTDFGVIVSILVHIMLLVVFVKTLKTRKIVAFSILVYFISFSLYSNLLFSIGTFMNERFMYVSGIGFSLMLGYLLIQVVKRNEKLGLGILVVVSLLSSIKTIARNYAWQNDQTLALTDVEVSTKSAKMKMSAGLALLDMAKVEKNKELKDQYLNEAFLHLRESINIYPSYAQPMILLGNTYSEVGDYNNAIMMYENCLKLQGEVNHAFQNLEYVGDKAVKTQSFEVAVLAYQTYLKYKNDEVKIYGKLGEVYGKSLGNLVKAEELLLIAHNLDKQNTNILQKLGVVFAIQGKVNEALDIFLQAEKIEPKNPHVLINVGLTYNNLGFAEKGDQYIQKAIEIDPSVAPQNN